MMHPGRDPAARRDRIVIAIAIVLSLVLLGACFAVPHLLPSRGSAPSGYRKGAPTAPVDEEVAALQDFLAGEESFGEAKQIVVRNYVDELEEEELLYAGARGIRRMADEGADEEALLERAITAMIDQLDDPHSAFMSAEELEALETQLSGRLSGIGVVMVTVKNEVRVSVVLEDSPALEAGLQEGDIVKEVDGRDVSAVVITELVTLIRGPEGTVVRLGVARPPSSDILHFEVTRREIEIPVLETEIKEDGVGYLRLTDWTQGADAKMAEALADLRTRGAKSLVIDLRSNPGGYMEPAIMAADLFLREGMIVSSRGRVAGASRKYKADGEVEWDLPVVVLVNRGSASSSEIFAAALRENERCLLVGETTFGKGSIQKIFRQADGTGIRLTIARYYTPSGTSIDDEGIIPDVKVSNPIVGEQDLQLEKAVELASSGP